MSGTSGLFLKWLAWPYYFWVHPGCWPAIRIIWPGVFVGVLAAAIKAAVIASAWFLVDPMDQFKWHWINALPLIVACIFYATFGLITLFFVWYHERHA